MIEALDTLYWGVAIAILVTIWTVAVRKIREGKLRNKYILVSLFTIGVPIAIKMKERWIITTYFASFLVPVFDMFFDVYSGKKPKKDTPKLIKQNPYWVLDERGMPMYNKKALIRRLRRGLTRSVQPRPAKTLTNMEKGGVESEYGDSQVED